MFTATAAKAPLDLLVFEIAGHRYAMAVASVTEVVRAVTITALPAAPRVVEGVVNFKGTLVPVLDIRMRFGLPSQPLNVSDLLIIANSGARLVALRCEDRALVRRLEPNELEITPDPLAFSPFVAGLAKFGDGTVVVHDLAAFLSEAESEELELALSADKRAGLS